MIIDLHEVFVPRNPRILELLFLLGCGFACLLLARPGTSFFGPACGSDWPTYIENAAKLWHPEWTELIYQDWRKPLHAFLVGLLGESLGYIRGAQWVTLLSTIATVLGAGLLGRSLGWRSTGVLAAALVAMLPTLEQSGRWVNVYPLLAGTSALALGLSAACLRWPRWWLGLLAGLAGGLAFAGDFRGVVPLVLSLAAVLVAAVVARSNWRTAVSIVGAGALGAATGWGLDQGLQAEMGFEARSLESQVAIQADVSIGPNLPPQVREACAAKGDAVRDPDTRRACAQLLLPHNWKELRSFEVLPHPAWLLLLLPALIPARWGRRSSIGAVLLLGGPVGAMLVGMALVAYPERYALLQLVAVAVALPIGLERLAERLSLRGGWRVAARILAAATVLAVGIWSWPRVGFYTRMPASFCREAGIPQEGLDESRAKVLAWAQETVGPDDLLLDCSHSDLDMLLLPQRLPIQQALLDSDSCARWVRQPPDAAGEVYLVAFIYTGGDPVMQGTQPDELRTHGWRLVSLPGLGTHATGRMLVWGR